MDIWLQVVREADGYQAHLVSPEFGLRRLVDETIGMVLEPVNMCVRRVHQVLIDAARYHSTEAASSSLMTRQLNCQMKHGHAWCIRYKGTELGHQLASVCMVIELTD